MLHHLNNFRYDMTRSTKDIFEMLMMESCKKHKEILELNLAVAAKFPDMTHLLGLGEGIISNQRGRIVQIGFCHDVSIHVDKRDVSSCYVHMPVWYNVSKKYLSTYVFSHLLKKSPMNLINVIFCLI